MKQSLLLVCLLANTSFAAVRQYSTNPFEFGLGSKMPTPKNEGMQEREAIEREYHGLYSEQPEEFTRRLRQKVAYRTYKKRLKIAQHTLNKAMDDATAIPMASALGGAGLTHLIKALFIKNPNIRHSWSKTGALIGLLGGSVASYYQYTQSKDLHREIDRLNTILQLDDYTLYHYVQELQTSLNLAAIGLPDPFDEDKKRIPAPPELVEVLADFQQQEFHSMHDAAMALRAQLVPLVRKRIIKLRKLRQFMTPLNAALWSTGALNVWDYPYTSYDQGIATERKNNETQIAFLKQQLEQRNAALAAAQAETDTPPSS